MIKNYKQYNNGIKSLLVGPTEEEVWDNIKNIESVKLFNKSIKSGLYK